MLSTFARNAALGAAALIAAWTTPAFAAATDYKFELVSAQPAGPAKTDVTVRLLHLPDNKPVQNAFVFGASAGMGTAGMASMPGEVTPGAAQLDGAYRYQVGTTMAGAWTLMLSAKIQGETQTVKGTVSFTAAP
jgi:hypothetical protein